MFCVVHAASNWLTQLVFFQASCAFVPSPVLTSILGRCESRGHMDK